MCTRPRMLAPATFVLLANLAIAQGQTSQPAAPYPIDACGVLVRGAECMLFEGGGGKFYIPDTGGFKAGDAVRVVGTVDPNCVTICQEGDGCIRGAVLYDPNLLPCGSNLPNFPGDLLSGLCTAASASLLTFSVVGLCRTRRPHR